MRRGQGLAFWAAVGGTSIVSLMLLNVVADSAKAPAGFAELRDYLVRRNG